MAAEKKDSRPDALGQLMESVPGRGRFALPGALCGPVFGNIERDGPAQRLLLAMCWLSSDTLREGIEARFQVPLFDLRHASGLGSYKAHGPVKEVAERLRASTCVFDEEGRVEIPIFTDMSFGAQGDLEFMEWQFDRQFSDLFIRPGRYAILDIRQIAGFRQGLDLFLYRHATLVCRMRRPLFSVPIEEMRRILDIGEDTDFRRIIQRLRRAVDRVERESGLSIEITPRKGLGSRRISSVVFEVGGGAQPG